MSARVVDLRSDTVTKPTAAMRAAMAAADVGDDVFGEDPTVARLERESASLLGKQAALYVPSGSMANQIALAVHCRPGDDVIVGEGAHNYLYEAGAGGGIAGVQFTIAGSGGLFTGDDVAAAFKDPAWHGHAPTRLVCVENTHNRGGGVAWTQAGIIDVAEAARKLGVALHLDGARLLNAAVATGVPAAQLAAPFDTATLCFSKGLGAPVGSVIAGSHDLILRAHRYRKMLGGGMRQAGILAAGALHALSHHVARLAEDHANARVLAEGIADLPGVHVDVARVQTNIVLVELSAERPSAAQVVAALEARDVLALAFGPRRIRLVTHLDVDRAACTRAVHAIGAVLK
jgi:threonine aldolase